MSGPRKIAIIAESEGARHFLGETVRLLGYEVGGPDEKIPSLRQEGSKLGMRATAEAEAIYFSLPQKASVLLSAFRNRIEKTSGGKRDIIIGTYTLDTYNHFLTGGSGNGEIRLTEKESAILLCLYKAGGGIVSRQAMLDEVWGYAQDVETHTLETHIYRLRQKIEKDPSNPEILKTEEDGYSLAL